MIRLLSGVLIVSILFVGCDKDDDNTNKKNYLKIGDKEYDLSAGILLNYGLDDDNSWYYGYNNDLLLYSPGLSLIEEDDDWDLTGKGHLVYFEMFSNSGNSLNNGDYTFSSTEPHPIGTFDVGEYIINYDPENDDYEEEVDIQDGKVSVSKSENEYSITINCTDENGIKITGFYKGTLHYFDCTVDNKSTNLKSIKTKKSRLLE
ncbi:MAG: hypothetical protein ACOCWC_04345 [Bacteroidota bacterium]